MTATIETLLRDGTLVRHRIRAYEGVIEGTTAIKECFTGGEAFSKKKFQYRVAIKNEAIRRIAPLADLEVVVAVEAIICARCKKSFITRPDVLGKACGRCRCGKWICPACLGCRSNNMTPEGNSDCADERKRFIRKATNKKTHITKATGRKLKIFTQRFNSGQRFRSISPTTSGID